jgi:XrtN system VIT domain protein
MKNQTQHIFKDATFSIGIGLILLSLTIFMFPEFFTFEKSEGSYFGIFVLNYLIAIIYFIIAWIREIQGFRLGFLLKKIEYGFIHLILCLISAYSLNRSIPIFEQSTPWLQVVLFLQGVILLMVFIKNQLPLWLQFSLWMLLGSVFSLFLYFSLTLIPIYPFGMIAAIGLGISLHAFVPLWFVIALLTYLLRKDNRTKPNMLAFGIGILLSVGVVSFYLVQWSNTNRIITRATDKSIMDEKNDLPEWTIIAQLLPKNALSERMLKTGLVYSVAPDLDTWSFFSMPDRNFDEVKKHDPLVMAATFFLGKPNLSEENKIKILESMYDSRHQAQERLWQGDDLETKHVLTNVRLYPSLRIGYTEKIISVRNINSQRTWRSQQEAIYTFHLPEGTVVTSLSLWINGKEEKGILTAKNKADSAYKSIVGVEMRDPSLVRWQEGNTVSVRIFPCIPKEDRRFKIGFTSPLRHDADKIIYDNIWFDGPGASNTDETIQIKTTDLVNEMISPAEFSEESPNTWTYEGKYMADWQLKIPVTPIQANAFTFNGKTYSISAYQKTFENFDPSNIYLDVNNQWTKAEFDQIRHAAGTRNIFVYHNQCIQLDDKNADQLFTRLTGINFSIFPIYEIVNPKNSLLISKGTSASPNVSDLGDSEFSRKLKSYLSENKPIRLFNLNNELSPYLKTLKELRVFAYDSGNANDLADLLNKKKFVHNQEDAQSIVINDAGIKITETCDSIKSNAPDHLMRLFSYNNVMYQTATNYFDKNYCNPEIVDKAYKAYIVSPVTSLVVLETKQDYERFGIKDDGVSLKNASMKSSGAVPEPHEWLLIIILAGVAAYLTMKRKKPTLAKATKNLN